MHVVCISVLGEFMTTLYDTSLLTNFYFSLITLFFSSSYVAFATNVFLYPRFASSTADTAFPAMICVYVSYNLNKLRGEHKILFRVNHLKGQTSWKLFVNNAYFDWSIWKVWNCEFHKSVILTEEQDRSELKMF